VDVVVVSSPADIADALSRTDVPIVLLGAPEDDDEVIALAELGVIGFVEHEASLDDLVVSVVNAARGEATLPVGSRPRCSAMSARSACETGRPTSGR
jgi:DNA-binding NarL/FixJ family response regulator